MVRKHYAVTLPEGFVKGKDIDPSHLNGHLLAIDPAGKLSCYIGYRRKDQPSDIPYYSISVAAKEPTDKWRSNFIELNKGTITRTSFLLEGGDYKILSDHRLVLPTGVYCDFGIVGPDGYDDDLTQQAFGGTHEELTNAALAFAVATGNVDRYENSPRLTFSKTQDNDCDLTDCLIPQRFPFIAFAGTQYLWGHVSLHGFFRTLAFVARRNGDVYHKMLENGLPSAVLDRLLDMRFGIYSSPLRSAHPWLD